MSGCQWSGISEWRDSSDEVSSVFGDRVMPDGEGLVRAVKEWTIRKHCR